MTSAGSCCDSFLANSMELGRSTGKRRAALQACGASRQVVDRSLCRLCAGRASGEAFSHLPAKLLAEDPRTRGGGRVLFFAGTDAPAKVDVAALIDKLGFFGIDLGQLNEGGRAINIPGGALTIQNLIRLE
jgi:hypothetical protein